MKKIILLFAMLTLGLSCVYAVCNETDSGDKPLILGTTIAGTTETEYHDSCTKIDLGYYFCIEYYCNESYVNSKSYFCDSATPTACDEEIGSYDLSYSDSDGGDMPLVPGTLILKSHYIFSFGTYPGASTETTDKCTTLGKYGDELGLKEGILPTNSSYYHNTSLDFEGIAMPTDYWITINCEVYYHGSICRINADEMGYCGQPCNDSECGTYICESRVSCYFSCDESRECSDGYACSSGGSCLTDSDGDEIADIDEIKEICDNGIDDDGDGKVDCKDVIDCISDKSCSAYVKFVKFKHIIKAAELEGGLLSKVWSWIIFWN